MEREQLSCSHLRDHFNILPPLSRYVTPPRGAPTGSIFPSRRHQRRRHRGSHEGRRSSIGVAVALGLVAPDTLEAQTPEPTSVPCEGCDGSYTEAFVETPAYEEFVAEAPTAEEFHRVELEWLKATQS